MRSIVTLLFLLGIISTKGGDLKYPVSAIPEELKKDVDVVVREDHSRFKITSKSSAVYYVHEVITIFNEKGNDRAKKIIGYDKHTKIADFNGIVYDANGKQIKKLKNSEIYDQSAFDGFSLYSDNRLKAADLAQAVYPYTVEFEYEVKYEFLYAIPGSYFGGEKISTQHASYQLIFPSELAPRYKVFNMEEVKPINEKLPNGTESVTWKLENIKPMNFESYGPSHAELIPHIIAAPSKFEYDGYEGDMSSWKDYGKWNQLLNQGRNDLP